MPRTGPRRPLVAIKLSEAGIARIDARAADRAKAEGRPKPNRSDEIRVMLAYAEQHMPARWTPKGRETSG